MKIEEYQRKVGDLDTIIRAMEEEKRKLYPKLEIECVHCNHSEEIGNVDCIKFYYVVDEPYTGPQWFLHHIGFNCIKCGKLNRVHTNHGFKDAETYRQLMGCFKSIKEGGRVD